MCEILYIPANLEGNINLTYLHLFYLKDSQFFLSIILKNKKV